MSLSFFKLCKLFYLAISIWLIFSIFGAAYASFGPAPAFFNLPGYIDPDYKMHEYSEILYDQHSKFRIILRELYSDNKDFQSFDTNDTKDLGPQLDAEARAKSQQQEMEYYTRYLSGAQKFHDRNYKEALSIFEDIKDDQGTWLSSLLKTRSYSWAHEASTYMIARCKLVMAQNNWDGYSNPLATVDQRLLSEAEAAYKSYIEEYPDGLYTDSARNIQRKILFLSGNQAGLDRELKAIMAQEFPASVKHDVKKAINFNIINEIKNLFRGDVDVTTDSPLLIAYIWLGDKPLNQKDILLLEGRKDDFMPYPGLFQYLRALGLYRLKDYQGLVNKTAELSITANKLTLSTGLLRARAFVQLDQAEEALKIYTKMHEVLVKDALSDDPLEDKTEDAIELEIAHLKLNQKNVIWLYSDQSPLVIKKVLAAVAQYGLSDDEIEKGLDDPHIMGDKRGYLIDELARRYLLSKRFKKLSKLLSQDQESVVFSSIKPAVKVLAQNSGNDQALADIGEFLYQNSITPTLNLGGIDTELWDENALDELLVNCEQCKAFEERRKLYEPPINFFRAVVDNAKKSGKKSEAEAKSLHYLTRCGRQGGEYQYLCQWTVTWGNSSDSTSKDAFMRLHKLYKKSRWTQKTPYYY